MELTRQFAKMIAETNYEDIPQEIIGTAKERLLDTIGAMIAGRAGWAYAEQLEKAVSYLGEGHTRPIGPETPAVYPVVRTAMLNATFSHAIELDDGHKNAGVHAGAVVISAALVMGAEFGASGKEVLTAIVLGYEVAYRLAVAQAPELIDHGFHPSATCDCVAAMAVTGKLMGLDEERLAAGLGMAGLQASGLMEATVSGQQSKCVMVGNAALNGISCAYVAREGLEGSTTVFEGKTGLFQAMSKKLDPDDVTKDMGKPFWITETYSKFYPTCRHSQPAIEAVLNEAEAHSLNPADVERIEVGTHHVAYNLTGTIKEPKNPGEAKFSIAYGAAAALLDHGVAVRHLTPALYEDPKYLEIAHKVTVTVDPDVDAVYPKKRGAKVKIVMKDGSEYSEELYDLKGSPQNPVGFDQIVNKFIVGATGLLTEEKIREVMDRCAAFEKETDLNTFLPLLNW